jgi:anti-sigma regulatory factor (Ser/Thr protein kinase)
LIKRMQLVVEEMFVNAIHHGYGAECDATVELALRIEGKQASLTFSDHARPFNLLQMRPLPANPERLGGVGLNLVRALTDAIHYRYDAGRNITTFTFRAAETSPIRRLSN